MNNPNSVSESTGDQRLIIDMTVSSDDESSGIQTGITSRPQACSRYDENVVLADGRLPGTSGADFESVATVATSSNRRREVQSSGTTNQGKRKRCTGRWHGVGLKVSSKYQVSNDCAHDSCQGTVNGRRAAPVNSSCKLSMAQSQFIFCTSAAVRIYS